MEALITTIAEKLSLDASTVRKAVGTILQVLGENVSGDAVDRLVAAMPGASELVAEAASEAGTGGTAGGGLMGALGGLMGGGNDGGAIGSLIGRMSSLGIDIGATRTIAVDLVEHAKKTAGPELVDEVMESVPALKQVL